MNRVLDLELMTAGGQIFARLTKFQIFAGSQTLSGVQFIFDFTIAGTEYATKTELVLDRLHIDLSLFSEFQHELYVGRFRDEVSESTHVTGYDRNFQRNLQLANDAYWRLVDSTHYRDLDLKFGACAVGSGDTPNGRESLYLRGERRVKVPHSDWLDILNKNAFDRFETITIRSQVSPTGRKTEIFSDAIAKLKEAEGCFDRGDWNGVGTRCRAAWRVFKTLVPKKDQGRAATLRRSSQTIAVLGIPSRRNDMDRQRWGAGDRSRFPNAAATGAQRVPFRVCGQRRDR